MPGPEPNKDYLPTLRIINKESTSRTNIIFTLEVAGPDHVSIFIEPLQGAKLVDWTFTKEPLEKSLPPPHYVYWSYALDPTPMRFNLEFEVNIYGIAISKNMIFTDYFDSFLTARK